MKNPSDADDRDRFRLQVRRETFEQLKSEIEPWLMEERDISAREALANVLAHLDAEIAEQTHQLEYLERAVSPKPT